METKHKTFLEIFQANGCAVYISCTKANIHHKTYYRWLKNCPEFAEAVTNAKESLLDFAENSLMAHITKKNLTATIFYLKTKGKDRGYMERVEQRVEATIHNQYDAEFTDKMIAEHRKLLEGNA